MVENNLSGESVFVFVLMVARTDNYGGLQVLV